VNDLRVDDRAARDHLPQRAEKLAEVTDAVLEQVRKARGPGAEQLEGVRLVRVLGQDHDADTRRGLLDRVRGVNALHRGRGAAVPRAGRGLAYVGQDRLWPVPAHRVEQLGCRADGGQHGHLARVLEQPPGPLTDQVVVVGDDDPYRAHPPSPGWPGPSGTSARSLVPPPRALSIVSAPFTIAILSARPARPRPRGAAGSKPHPSSLTSTARDPLG